MSTHVLYPWDNHKCLFFPYKTNQMVMQHLRREYSSEELYYFLNTYIQYINKEDEVAVWWKSCSIFPKMSAFRNNGWQLLFSLTINSYISHQKTKCHMLPCDMTWLLCISAFIKIYNFAVGIWFDCRSVIKSLSFMKSSLVKWLSPTLGQLGLWSLSERAPSACSELSCFHFWRLEPSQRHSKHYTSQTCQQTNN